VVLLGIFMNASIPLGVEMSADAAYPINEGTSTSILVWVVNVLSFILLFILPFLPSKLVVLKNTVKQNEFCARIVLCEFCARIRRMQIRARIVLCEFYVALPHANSCTYSRMR